MRKWSDFEIKAALWKWNNLYGYPPHASDLNKANRAEYPSVGTCKDRFGSLNKALAAAGLPTRPRGRPGHRDYDPYNPTFPVNS